MDIIVINFASNLILKISGIKFDTNKTFSASDIENALLEISADNLLPKYAGELSKGIKYLEKLKISSILKPRHEVKYSLISEGIDGLVEIFRKTAYNKILLCEENLDNIVGVVYLKDIVKNSNVVVSRKPVFIYEHASFDTIVEMFKKDVEELDLIIAVDEYGQVTGIITKTDVINTISGFLYKDNSYIVETIIESQEVIFKGDAKIEVVLSALFKNEEETNKVITCGINIHDTLSNYILMQSKKIPDENEKFTLCGLILEVIDRSSKKIEKVKVYKKNKINL